MTKEEARELVVEYLAKAQVGRVNELVIMDDRTRDEEFGWVFFYNSKQYADTGDIQFAVGGNSPLIVDRETGELHRTGTARPLEYYLDEYRQRRATR